MSSKASNKTKKSFLILLLHIAYIVLFAVFMSISGWLEIPCYRGGIYLFFADTSIGLLLVLPFVTTLINTVSIIFQIIALRCGESKVKNVIMMAITILYEIAVIVVSVLFWQGAMSV